MHLKAVIMFLLTASIAINACAQTLPDDIDISNSPNGVVDLPANVGAVWANNGFVKYTKIQTPNNKAIHFVAQDQLTETQIVRARNILQFFLNNLPDSEYGSNKTAVMNQMAENEALLLLLNGADGEGNEPNVNGQYLFQDEIAVEGHSWYINNNWDHRDAAFEEILHLMHDTGIGVDGPNSFPGALPEYQAEIRAAQENAALNNFAIWPIGANNEPDTQDWYNELSEENSLSQEYIASVIDTYYGLWGAWTETPGGMWGIYVAKTREDLETLDPQGLALIPKYFAPFINVDMDIDPSFTGTFSMSYNESLAYTHKSQYLQHCILTGTNNSNLLGNDLYNRLTGNEATNELEGGKGNDRLDGKAGIDIAVFTGNQTDYNVNTSGEMTIVTDNIEERDGVDTLWNIETIRFVDAEIALSTNVENIDAKQVFNIFPVPSSEVLNIEWKNSNPINSGILRLLDGLGRIILEKPFHSNEENLQLQVSDFPAGNYIIQVIGEEAMQNAQKQFVIL